VVIQVTRLTGGKRKVSTIAEITGTEGDTVCLQELFRFRQTGVGADGHAKGQFEACGIRPRLIDRIEAEGISLPANLFERRAMSSTAVAPVVQTNGKAKH